MLEKIKRSKAAVSTMVLAVVAILVVTVAAAGIYFFVLSDDGKEEWHGLDLSDPMIQGTLGIGTEYTYSYSIDDEPASELKMTIIGQSGSYYAYEITGASGISDRYGMIHKQTGRLRFSESEGTDGEYDGEILTKWKLSTGESTEIDKTGNEDVVSKANAYLVFSSNSKSILPYKFEVHYEEEVGGQRTQYSYVYKAELTGKDRKDPTEYEMSKHIGDRGRLSVTFKEDNKTTGNGNISGRIVGDLGSDKYLMIQINEMDKDNNKESGKWRQLMYNVTSDFFGSYDSYTKGPDATINTKWGEKNCDYYYYEYNGSSNSYKSEYYVGKDDKIEYLYKATYTYPDYTESTEYVLEEYVMS